MEVCLPLYFPQVSYCCWYWLVTVLNYLSRTFPGHSGTPHCILCTIFQDAGHSMAASRHFSRALLDVALCCTWGSAARGVRLCGGSSLRDFLLSVPPLGFTDRRAARIASFASLLLLLLLLPSEVLPPPSRWVRTLEFPLPLDVGNSKFSWSSLALEGNV